jgi:hypothetical protein
MMRSLFALHPGLRTGLIALAVVVVALLGGIRLWTIVPPDAVHITISRVDASNAPQPIIQTITVDRTIHKSAVAQRLQQDLARLPFPPPNPFATYTCLHDRSIYDTYTLTWYRAGLPVEHAEAHRTGCGWWWVDHFFLHLATPGAETLYADIDAALNGTGN